MSKHTPGPWVLGEERFGAQVGVYAGDREVADCGHNHIDCGNEEDRANARLIAAAPELAEVLKAAEELLSAASAQALHGGNLALMAAINERLHGIRAALRKAGA